MKIATVSHSHIALRQQLFFREVARQGHDVLMIAPGEWRNLRAQNYDKLLSPGAGNFRFRTCRHIGGEDIYLYRLLGARDLVNGFQPDWVYVQAEPGSITAYEVSRWGISKAAIFTWENIHIFKDHPTPCDVLSKYDLVICGNPEAVELVKPCNPNTFLMLQVGVDTDHFRARPNVERDMNVAYIGRAAPEKGLPYLLQAWPMAHILEHKDFKELPWWYSQVKVVVAYSQDTTWWKEQAPNYVLLEAMATECLGVASDTAAMKYWLEGAPGIVIVEGHEQPDGDLRLDRVLRLKEGIQKALDMPDGIRKENREYVISKFSNKVIAQALIKVLSSS